MIMGNFVKFVDIHNEIFICIIILFASYYIYKTFTCKQYPQNNEYRF